MSKGKRKQEIKKVHVNYYAKQAENKGPKPAEMEAEHPGWMDEQCKKAVEKRDGIRPGSDSSRLSDYDFSSARTYRQPYGAVGEPRRRLWFD